MSNNKPNMAVYRLAQLLSGIVQKAVFHRRFIRNEIKNQKGPMVIIGNHQAALDFTTLIGATKEHITFVVSDSFYNTLPLKKQMDAIGVISKQQFQTSIKEVAAMKSTVKHDGILMFYPTGLMTEDGLSTPTPAHTYEFLQWLGADVYAARITGSYFCTPKWSSKVRPGRTYLDVYKLIDKDELAEMNAEQIKEAVSSALDFDAYREQEERKVRYLGARDIRGLENVLYICPRCKREFTVKTKGKSTLYCTECGFKHKADKYGFLHNTGVAAKEYRYVSDWSHLVYDQIKSQIENGEFSTLSCRATVQTIDRKKHKYVNAGVATVTLTPEKFILEGAIDCKYQRLEIPISQFAALPFKPGCRIEIQHNKTTYRCLLDDGRLASKYMDMVKIYYQINQESNI